MRIVQATPGRGAMVALLLCVTLLTACGKSKATATPSAPTTAAPANSVATTSVATSAAVTPSISATAVVIATVATTPTPLATSTATPGATSTALSATSTAFVATIAASTPAVASTTNATSTTSAASTPVDPQAQALVDKARARFDQVNTLHFVLTVDGDVYLDKLRTERLRSAEGDLIRPDKVSLKAKASVGPINAQLSFIQIGDTAYLTNILTGKWEQAPAGFAYDPRLVYDKDRGVSAIMGKVKTWTLVGKETVNGTETQHVHGTVPTADVNDLVTSSLRGDNVDVDLYIEPKNNDVVRFILAEQASAVAPGTPANRWTLDLSKQNENITIEAPKVGS